ncbi:MAG: MSCRAMM family protein [Candidatus Bathyarchaeia archaeon]
MNEAKKLSGMITGKIYDEKGRCLGGVKIRCGDLETRTLFDGSYGFNGLSPGLHSLMVDFEGYRSCSKQVDLKEGEIIKLDLHLEPDSGNAKIWGYVLDSETKNPISGGDRIFMLRFGENRSVPVDPRTGYYEFNGLPYGEYKIWIPSFGYKEEQRIVKVEDAEEKRVDFLCEKAENEPLWG